MKNFYVYSTLSTDMVYAHWVPGGADLPSIEHRVMIRGGAGIANKNIITPLGVVTEVSEQDLSYLKGNKVFQLHEKNGFIRVEEKQVSVEKVVAFMEAQDESAPLTPADYPEDAPGPQLSDALVPARKGGKRSRKAE